MKLNCNKVLASILAIVMIISVFPMATFAVSTDYSMTNAAVEVNGTEDKSVTINLIVNADQWVYAAGGNLSYTTAGGDINMVAFAHPGLTGGMSDDYYNVSTGNFKFVNSMGAETPNGTVLLSATYSVDKDTPTGVYTVDLVLNIEDDDDTYRDIALSATITVTNSTAAAPTQGLYIYYKNSGTDSDSDNFYEVEPGATASFDIYVKSDSAKTLQAFDIYPLFDGMISVSYNNNDSITSHTGSGIVWHTDNGGHLQSVANGLNLSIPAYDSTDPATEIKIATIQVTLSTSAVYDTHYSIYFDDDSNLAVGGSAASAVIATGGVDITGGVIGLETRKTYTVSYNANTTDTVTNLPANQTKQHNVALTLSSQVPVRDGYTFKGWSTTEGAVYNTTDTYIAAGATFEENANTTLYAVWKQDFYTVTWYDLDGTTVLGTSSIAANAQPAYPTDASWHLPVKPANTDQYSYGDLVWATTAGQNGGTALASLPAVTDDVSYYAVYPQTTNSYTVTWKSWDGNTTYGTKDVEYGQKPALPDGFDPATEIAQTWETTQYIYTFANWAGTQETIVAGALPADLPAVTGNVTYYVAATREGQTYTVTLDPNGGTPAPDPAQTVDVQYGEPAVTLPTSVTYTKQGYEFAGWNTSADGTGTDITQFSNLEANQIVYAKWTPITYKVHFNGNGETSGTMDDQTFTYDATPTVALTANAFHKTIPGMEPKEYVFKGWSLTPDPALDATVDLSEGAGIGLGNNLSSTKDEVVNLYAVWKQADFIITYNLDGGTNHASNPNGYNTLELPLTINNNPTKEGYTFDGWTTTDIEGYTTANTTVVIPAGTQKDITLTAHWTANDVGYKVKFWQQDLNDTDDTAYTEMAGDMLTEHGLTDATTTVDFSSSDIINKYPGFELNTTKSDGNKTILGNGNTVINVYYIRKTYSVTYQYSSAPTGAPAVPTDGVSYRHGATVPIKPVTDEVTGYTFSGWTPNLAGWSAGDPVIVNAANIVFTGSWTANNVKYYIEFYQQDLDNEANYSKIDADTEHPDGYADAMTTVDFTDAAITNKYPGFELASHDDNTAIARAGDTIIKIYYNRLSYDVTYSYTNDPVPTGATALPATVSYKYGAPVSIADAATAPGYSFEGWKKGGANAVDFNMPAEAVAITGTFTAIKYTIHFESGVTGIAAPADIEYYITDTSITMPAALTGRTNYTFFKWKVTTPDGSWTSGSLYNASEAISGAKYGYVTLTAQWTADFTYSIEEYKYAPSAYLMLIVKDEAADGNVYTFDGADMFWTDDASYQIESSTGVYVTLIPNGYIIDTDATPMVLNDVGMGKISEVSGTKTEIAYDGDINGDGTVNVADANAIYQMLGGSHGGYYSLDQLNIKGRLEADMYRADTAEKRASIKDVDAVVTIINTEKNP